MNISYIPSLDHKKKKEKKEKKRERERKKKKRNPQAVTSCMMPWSQSLELANEWMLKNNENYLGLAYMLF